LVFLFVLIYNNNKCHVNFGQFSKIGILAIISRDFVKFLTVFMKFHMTRNSQIILLKQPLPSFPAAGSNGRVGALPAPRSRLGNRAAVGQ
jgi:hypothetical protein